MKFEEFRNWLRNNDFTTDISIGNSYDYYWELIFEKEYFNNEFQYFIDEPVGENKDYICLNAFKLLNISNVDDYKIFDNFDLKMFLYYFKFKDLFKNKKYEFTVEMIPPIDCTIEEWNNIEFTEDFASPLICKTDISLEKKYIDVVEQHNDNYFVTGQLTNKQIDWIVNVIDKKMKDFIDKNPIDKFITLLKSVRFINLDCGNNEDILNIKYKDLSPEEEKEYLRKTLSMMIDIDLTKLQLIFDFMYEKKVYFNFSEFMEENITYLNQTHNLKKYNDKVSIIIEGGPHIDIKRILSNLRTEKLACYKYIPIYKNNANEEYVGEVYALYKYANGEVVVDYYNRISYEL